MTAAEVIGDTLNMLLCDGRGIAGSFDAEAQAILAALRAAPPATRLAREIAPDTHAVVPRATMRAVSEALHDAVEEFYGCHSSGDPNDPNNMQGEACCYRDCKAALALVAAAEPGEGCE